MTLWTQTLLLALALASTVEAKAMELYYSRDEQGYGSLIANGQIGLSDAAKINSILAASARRGEPVAIYLTSEGGVLEATPAIAQAILNNSRRLKAQTGVSNLLVINEGCDSACSVLTTFLTNQRTQGELDFVVTPGSIFGVHSPVEYENHSVTPILDPVVREESTQKMISYYLKAGARPGWIRSHDKILHQSEMTNISARRLCWTDSKIIPFDSCLWFDRDISSLVESKMQNRVLLRNLNLARAQAMRK